ncbi:hypothetical protein J2X02_003598 [Pseudoxanthomonas japonensis]|uniref:hypothetical protein n=1 Tax=Pseudoxanthomonas japonensis TaxID=69284 RepID=UPI001A37AE63|nr:hypothetical protein [Pseudoxanthomonas japonensis]MBL8257249.1 hypothetical protein [Pseudoxanthomonas mexicana]MDR7070729.1 hypothetical protein [Pseudoxanthomonas japonensis]
MDTLAILLKTLFIAWFMHQVVFWLLFFFVVKVRIADKALVVDEVPRFSFLLRRWPHEEMRAYRRSLSDEEKRRWINRYLCNASFLVWLLMGSFLLGVLFMVVVGD